MGDEPYDYRREEELANNGENDPEVRGALKRIEQNYSAEYCHIHPNNDRCYLIDGQYREAVGHRVCRNPNHAGPMLNPLARERSRKFHDLVTYYFGGDVNRLKEWIGEQGL